MIERGLSCDGWYRVRVQRSEIETEDGGEQVLALVALVVRELGGRTATLELFANEARALAQALCDVAVSAEEADGKPVG